MKVGTAPDRAVARWSSTRGSDAVAVAAVALAALAGAAVALGRVELALAATGLVFGVAAVRELSVVAWCGLLLVTTVAMRGAVSALSLPETLNFLHYPVVAGLALAALRRPPRASSRAPGVWLAGLVAVTAVSAAANLTEPLRALVFLLIVGEPLVVVWALARWEIRPRDRRRVGAIVVALAAIQLPIALAQAVALGVGDPVQGTLTGHGAGHHVLGALFALGLLVVVAGIATGRIPAPAGIVGGALCLAMMLGTGAMAVTILTALVVPVVAVLGARARRAAAPVRGSGRVLPVLAAASFAAGALVLSQLLVPQIYERVRYLATPEGSPELELLLERQRDPGAMAFGSGPGTSASRASILLIGAEEDEGSPIGALGLEPTPQALEIAATTRLEGGGSAESARSSALGVIGDLGLVGLAGLGILLAVLWREAARSRHWLAAAALGAVALTGMLAFVDSWLEYPEFTVPLAVLLGMVLTESGAPPGSARRT